MIFLYISDITIWYQFCLTDVREVTGTLATSKMELFMTLVNGLQPITNVTKNSILDAVGVLDIPLNEALSAGKCLSSRTYLQADIKESLSVSIFKPNLKP